MDSLPDDILIHILSFLPMKQAASTSVLSKRWRTLFAFTHNLDFDDPIFSLVSNNYTLRESHKIFRDFVYRTLALQAGTHVNKFSLTLKNCRDCDLIIRRSLNNSRDCDRIIRHWIDYALKHGVSELHICISGDMSFLTRVFTSTTLVKLSLESSYGVTSLPSDTSFPSLKVLLLNDITFQHGQLSDVLLAACPVLEDFTIQGFPKYSLWVNPGYTDAITSKNIKNLYYCGKCLFTYYQFDLLVKATLDIRVEKVFMSIKQNVEKLISGIRNVKTLHLSFSAVEAILACCKDKLPVFNNLVDLVFSSNKQGWKVLLPRLLECSPNLKVLVLSGLHRYTFQIHRRFVGIQIPLENQIEKLSIKQYQGSANELRHIGHILLNMECLKVVKVYVAATMDEPKKMQLIEDLMKLPTASSEVKIQVI